jgi:aryl sulfotransferase
MGSIIWLASYPKSGNTWFRVFLTNYIQDGNEPADINALEKTPIASARGIFDDETGIESSDLYRDEIDLLRPAVYEKIASESNDTLFMKVHDAWRLLPNGTSLFPDKATAGVIYIIRNPMDVAVSNANFNGISIDKVISNMNNPEYKLAKGRKKLSSQLRQTLLSWSRHVLSWTDQSKLKHQIIRYEDMIADPVKTFSSVIDFIELNTTSSSINLNVDLKLKRIKKAIFFSSFDVLKKMELDKGFKEKSSAQDKFFRKGIVGDWRNKLSKAQVDRLVSDHYQVMKKFNYLNLV